MSGFLTEGLGLYEKSIDEGNQAIGIDPDFIFGYTNRACPTFTWIARARPTIRCVWPPNGNWNPDEFFLLRYFVAFLTGDRAGMDRQVALAKDRPGAEDWIDSCAGSRLRFCRSSAAGTRFVAARRGRGPTGQRSGKSGDLRKCGSGVRSAFGESVGGEAESSVSAGVVHRPGCGVCRRFCARPSRGSFTVGAARQRFGSALSGRHVSPIPLTCQRCAHLPP